MCLTAYRDKLDLYKISGMKTFKPRSCVTVSPSYFKLAFEKQKKEKKKVDYLSVRAKQLALSAPSAQHPAWAWSQERRQKWPLWKSKFPQIYQITQMRTEKTHTHNNNTSRFDVYLGRKKLAEEFVDNRWVEKLLSQFTGMSTGRKNHHKEHRPPSITQLNNSLLRQLTRKFCHLKYSIIRKHWSCKTSKIVSIYIMSVSTHQAVLELYVLNF